MRNRSIVKIIMVMSLFFAAPSWGEGMAQNSLIQRGVHRFIGHLQKTKDNQFLLIINKSTQSPFFINVDLGKSDGVKSFVGNTVDLELNFSSRCIKSKQCPAQIKRFHGIYEAYKKVPIYPFKPL